MRVLIISKACVVGIYQRKLEEIARLGVDLTVVVPPAWRDERGVLALERTHIEGYRLLTTPMALNGSFHLHYYPRLQAILDEVRPEIVHVDEEPYNLSTRQAMGLARRIGARALFFTWQNHLRRYPPPFCWWEQYAYQHAAYAIAGNHDAVQVLRTKGYAGPAYVIPQFGVDPALYGTATPPSDTFVIGYVGRLVPEKGIEDLLRAASQLPGNSPAARAGYPFRSLMVRLLGSGPEHERLLGLAQSLGISDRVTFDGQIPSSEVPSYLARLHALVLPSHTRSNWKEQFGRVLVEAMASSVPVVGSSSGEIPNVIGDAGLVYPEGDVTTLRAHLQALMSDATLWADLSRRGRARVLAYYTQAQIAAETVAVYEKAMRQA